MKYVEWTEPDKDGHPIFCCMPAHFAILAAHAHAKALNHTYANDQEALLDFLATHWATEREL